MPIRPEADGVRSRSFVRTEVNGRENNEDAFHVFGLLPAPELPPVVVLALADGMGGLAHGEHASREGLRRFSLALFERLGIEPTLNCAQPARLPDAEALGPVLLVGLLLRLQLGQACQGLAEAFCAFAGGPLPGGPLSPCAGGGVVDLLLDSGHLVACLLEVFFQSLLATERGGLGASPDPLAVEGDAAAIKSRKSRWPTRKSARVW